MAVIQPFGDASRIVFLRTEIKKEKKKSPLVGGVGGGWSTLPAGWLILTQTPSDACQGVFVETWQSNGP